MFTTIETDLHNKAKSRLISSRYLRQVISCFQLAAKLASTTTASASPYYLDQAGWCLLLFAYAEWSKMNYCPV